MSVLYRFNKKIISLLLENTIGKESISLFLWGSIGISHLRIFKYFLLLYLYVKKEFNKTSKKDFQDKLHNLKMELLNRRVFNFSLFIRNLNLSQKDAARFTRKKVFQSICDIC